VRQPLISCFRITAPPTNRGILFILSASLALLFTLLAAKILGIPVQLRLLSGLEWIAFAAPWLVFAFVIWKGLCLLSDGTLDHIEVGPEGLVVRGLLGLKHRRWDEIEDFAAKIVQFRFTIISVTASPTRAPGKCRMRFYLSGCFKIGLFDYIDDQQDTIADWLREIRAAYRNGTRDGSLPLPPTHFIGCVIDLPAGSVAAKVSAMHPV
jgi:hypothetical protein